MKINVVGKNHCKYCDMIQVLLFKEGKEYTYRTMESMGPNFFKEWMEIYAPNAKTFPIVLVNEEYIGGYNQLKKLLEKDDGL